MVKRMLKRKAVSLRKEQMPLGMVAVAVVAVVAIIAGAWWLTQPAPASVAAVTAPTAVGGAVLGPAVSPAALVGPGKATLVETALKDSEVQAYAGRNPGYFVDDTVLSQADLDAQAAKYPVIYGGLSLPIYQLRFSSGSGEGLLVLLNSTSVVKVFAVQSLRLPG